MQVEEPYLAYNRGADELRVLVDLGTNFQAISARDATRKRIPDLLQLRRHARPFAQIMRSINRDPALRALQVAKHFRAVDLQIAHERKLRQRLKANRLLEIIDQCRACLSGLSIDQHCTRAAYFFQTIRLVADWRRFFAVTRDRLFRDIPQALDHVQVRSIPQLVLFPAYGLVRPLLPLDPHDERFLSHLVRRREATLSPGNKLTTEERR